MKHPLTSIQYPLNIDDDLGILMEEKDYEQHIKSLMRGLLLCGLGERWFRPDMGTPLRKMVFEPNSEITAGLIRITVLQSLDKWLGDLIQVDQVEVRSEEEKLHVSISYVIRSQQERQYLNLEVVP